jgi:hypothetical protein
MAAGKPDDVRETAKRGGFEPTAPALVEHDSAEREAVDWIGHTPPAARE